MSKSRLHELSDHGQSVWIDSLSREWLETGELARMIDEDAVVGVTSNPTIFQKALAEGDWYDEQLREVLTGEDEDKEVFYRLAARDIQAACDLLRRVWDEGKGQDGYVSMEVDPDLAYDREATIDEAMRFHEWIDRRNLFVKIPATEPGLGAIEECIARGRPINVTLIFSLERHEAVAEAYIRGLERLVESGGDPSTVASVASFFVSRVDTEADKRLEAIGTDEALALRGQLAIANAKLAYENYKRIFSGERWEPLERDGDAAKRLLDELAAVGVDYDDVVDTLEREGVQKFSDSFRELLDGIRAKRAALVAA